MTTLIVIGFLLLMLCLAVGFSYFSIAWQKKRAMKYLENSQRGKVTVWNFNRKKRDIIKGDSGYYVDNVYCETLEAAFELAEKELGPIWDYEWKENNKGAQ